MRTHKYIPIVIVSGVLLAIITHIILTTLINNKYNELNSKLTKIENEIVENMRYLENSSNISKLLFEDELDRKVPTYTNRYLNTVQKNEVNSEINNILFSNNISDFRKTDIDDSSSIRNKYSNLQLSDSLQIAELELEISTDDFSKTSNVLESLKNSDRIYIVSSLSFDLTSTSNVNLDLSVIFFYLN